MLIALSDFAVKVNNVRQSTEKRFTDFVGNDRSSIDHNTSLAPQNATKKCQSQYGNDRAVHTCHDYIMHATSFGHYIYVIRRRSSLHSVLANGTQVINVRFALIC